MLRFLLVFVVAMCAGLSSAIGAAPDALPTQADAQSDLDAGKYPDAMQKVTRLLTLKGKAADPYDRHALLRIKGETHLRLKALQLAAAAFDEASKNTVDGPSAAQDIATALLIKKSNATLMYQPKGHDPEDKTKPLPPLDIVEAESRKKAVKLLFSDEWAVLEPRVKLIEQGKTLPPILAALPAIRDVRWLEMASTGHDERTKELVAQVAKKAQTLLDTSMKSMKESADAIEQSAMEVSVAHVPVNDKQTGKILYFRDAYRYRGPNSGQLSALRDIVSTCMKVHDSSDELGGTLGATGKEFDTIKEESKDVGTKANTLLTKDWRTTYDSPPPPAPPKK